MPDTAAGLTDLCLSATALSLGFGAIWRGRVTGGAGLVLLGVAAGLGTVRFLIRPSVAFWHEHAMWVAATVGLPLIGVGYVQRHRPVSGAVAVVILIAASGLAGSPVGHGAYGRVAPARGLFAGLGVRLRTGRLAGAGGALLVVLAGLFLRPVSEALALPFVPTYHLLLTVAALLLWRGLVEGPSEPTMGSEDERTP